MPDTYKLINATKEEACREAEANAIRAKTGDSQNIDYDFINDKGFADAIAAIPSGKEEIVLNATANGTYTPPSGKVYGGVDVNVPTRNEYYIGPHEVAGLVRNTALFYPEDAYIEVDARNTLSSTFRAGYNCPGYTEAHVVNCSLIPATGIDVSYLASYHRYSGTRGFKRLYLDAPLVISNILYAFYDNRTLEAVYGDLDLNLLTSISDTAFGNNSLERITFVKSSIKESLKFGSTSLDDVSLVSIANGLDGTQTGKTLTLTATSKSRCDAITGIVSDGVYAEDISGTVILSDFITQTKGWTLMAA